MGGLTQRLSPQRPPTFASPFGSARLQILGGLVGGILVLSSSFLVLLEAGVNMVAAPEAGAPRGCKPHPTPPPLGLVEAADFPISASAPSPQPTAPSRPALVVATALVGSVANACGAVLLSASGSPHGHSHDHGHGHGGESSGRGSIARSMTVRGVVAHMATDAFSGATVAASALAQHTAFASYADLAACAAVVALSLYSTLPVLRDSARAALLTSPAGDGMRLAEQRRDLEDRILGCGGVSSVRQLRLLWIASDWVEALVEVGLEGGDEGRACDARVAECVREALLAAGMQEATVHVSEPPAGRGKRAA